MSDYSVESDDCAARLLSDGRLVVSIALDEVQLLYEVVAGSDVLANDSLFWIIELKDKLVIVPEDAVGMLALLERWRTALERGRVAFNAVCYLPPKAWRRKRWGVFRHYEAKLCVVAKVDYSRAMPEWKVLGPLHSASTPHAAS